MQRKDIIAMKKPKIELKTQCLLSCRLIWRAVGRRRRIIIVFVLFHTEDYIQVSFHSHDFSDSPFIRLDLSDSTFQSQHFRLDFFQTRLFRRDT